jgi:arylsulfatase A-like enzyme/Tfp pilus assembly protein PilF
LSKGRKQARPAVTTNHQVGRRPLSIAVAAIGVSLSIILAWFSLSPHRTAIVRDANRNVLLVTIDTLRADALGAYRGLAATPNLDRLAADGLRFTAAHAHAVVTLPSHASILTGVYPFAHGVRDNAGYRLPSGTPTMATLLKQVGYATGAFVGAFPLDSRWGLDRGFDEYDDRYGGTSRLGELLMPERRAADVVNAATAWIQRQQGKWFAWVHVYDPHAPYEPPAPFDREYSGNPYAGEVAYTDRALAPLFDLARSSSRQTVIVVTADHGESLGNHGEETHGLFAYEPTLHVPLIVDLTNQPHAFGASPTDLPARHVDILPTVLDVVGVQSPTALPGRSLVHAIEAADSSAPASYFESMSPFLNRGWAPLTGVIVGRDKYIDLPIPELYDLAEDPAEARNLVSARDDRRRVLDARLREVGSNVASTDVRIAESGETKARLQALGYVSGSTHAKAQYTEEDDPKRLVDLDRKMQAAVSLFQRGQLRESLAIYEELIRRRPTMSASYLHAAHILWELGNPGDAVETLRAATRSGADAPDVGIQLGIYLAESGSPEEAVRLLEPLQQQPTPDLDGLNSFGIALDHLHRPGEALAVFDRILELDPGNADAHQNKGTVYLEQGNLGAAREALTRALRVDPKLPKALNGMGVVELKSGNRAAAIDAWRRAVEIDPRQYDTLFNLGITLLEMGDRAAARKYLEQFIQTAPPVFYAKDIESMKAELRRLR